MAGGLPGYREIERNGWRIWLNSARWRDAWFPAIGDSLPGLGNVVRESRHARTGIVALREGAVSQQAYLKLYRTAARAGRLKDVFRLSRARRALVMSHSLARDQIAVPPVLAAGEQRSCGIVERGFLLTSAVNACGLHDAPLALSGSGEHPRPELKRRLAAAVGAEVARFHALGYLHGDLVVTNLLVRWMPAIEVWFLDHDRTRKIGPAFRARRQRRNLVHLNRHGLLGVHHSDRLRLFLSYARTLGWTRDRCRREARWIARKTLQVRRKR